MSDHVIYGKLKEQYGFLKRSVQTFMDGHPEEALRLATTLRVLVHETAKSKPLLKELKPDYLSLKIKDIVSPPSTPGSRTLFRIAVPISMNTEKGIYPNINMADPAFQLVPLSEWWAKEILVTTTESSERIVFTRRQIILTLANKEGGAHVDTDLPRGYEKFVTDSPLKFALNNVKSDSIHLARFSAVNSAAEMIDCLERDFPEALQ